MLTVALLLTLALQGATDHTDQKIYDTCATNLKTQFPSPISVDSESIAPFCNLVRFDFARCIAHKRDLKTDDGSVASRGKVVVDLLQNMKNNTNLLHTTRLYHYGCIYNDIGIWLRNQTCFDYMLQRCVMDDGDCYGLVCRPKDNPKVLRVEDGAEMTMLWIAVAVAAMVIY